MNWHMIGFAALAVLSLAFIGLLGYRLGRHLTRRLSEEQGAWAKRHGTSRGLAALAERYARGEIDEAEYRARKAVLEA